MRRRTQALWVAHAATPRLIGESLISESLIGESLISESLISESPSRILVTSSRDVSSDRLVPTRLARASERRREDTGQSERHPLLPMCHEPFLPYVTSQFSHMSRAISPICQPVLPYVASDRISVFFDGKQPSAQQLKPTISACPTVDYSKSFGAKWGGKFE